MKYVCKNCNFRFERDVTANVIKCPYCGRFEAVKEQSAEELLEDD
jgi:DNA-directed RNA polymerase subunit RPC12/RpoP